MEADLIGGGMLAILILLLIARGIIKAKKEK